jgi:(4-O-methyl)-D-glucuronate---lignin esterase
MNSLARFGLSILVVASVGGIEAYLTSAWGQVARIDTGPDPREIPVPEIATTEPAMPGVDQLPDRPELPEIFTMQDGTKITSLQQWPARREEMKRILEYYDTGFAPPPPGNVVGTVLDTEWTTDKKVKYRLVHLSFGPGGSLGFDIGIYTPAGVGPMPVVIMPDKSPPGSTALAKLPMTATQGKGVDVLLTTGPAEPDSPATRPTTRIQLMLEGWTREMADFRQAVLDHGYALVVFDNNDCGEDSTLRLPDGSWAYRTTRYYPAYSQYDWGLCRGWAWGMSRIVDYLETDRSVDSGKIIVTGVSRTGKAALFAGAFDDRIALVAPIASSGGGTPAYRFSGAGRGGKEGLADMMRKYPNWFSPHLHPFWGHVDKLPFDNHWFYALIAPRPCIALEGFHDENVNINGVKQAWLAGRAAYDFFGVQDRLGVNWSDRPHGVVAGDWDALFSFADEQLLGKRADRTFDQFPAAGEPSTMSGN